MSPSRLYLPSTGAAAVSPAFDTEWELTTSATRLAAVTTRISSAQATVYSGSIATQFDDGLCVQFVSAPIAAGPIAGTLKGQLRASRTGSGGGASGGLRAQIVVRVVSNDGSTFRGTLYAGDLDVTNTTDPTSEFAGTATNRAFPRGGAVALSPVSAQTNDRIVIELGARRHGGDATPILTVGDNSGTDLPEDETTTTAGNPWIEFSVDVFTSRLRGARAYILD